MVALISDTHGNVQATARALELLDKASPDRFIHLGDIGNAAVVTLFGDRQSDFLWGNNDTNRDELLAAVKRVGAEMHSTLELQGSGGTTLLAHGHTTAIRDGLRSRRYSAVIFGHSHERMNELRDGVRFINPGALYRARDYSCALFDPDTLEVTFVMVPKE